MNDPVSRLTVYFSGHVQGVGFRYSVLQVAKGFMVAGTVANLADGRVKLVVEGEAAELRAFVDTVKESLGGFIRQTEESKESGPRRFKDFTITPGLE